jgi:hypothetical protein
MLWMKAWLEMRWRLVLGLGLPLAIVLLTAAPNLRAISPVLVLLFIWTAVYLAGGGIRTQSTFRATRGINGSTFFTLSLPVSRLRLLATRSVVGLIGTAGVIVISICTLWLKFPLARGNWTIPDLLELAIAAIVCTACFHFASVLFATFLDEVWQTFGCMFVIFAAWWAVAKLSLPQAANIFSFMGDASPLVTHELPWPAMAISLIASAILFLAALKVVQKREY